MAFYANERICLPPSDIISSIDQPVRYSMWDSNTHLSVCLHLYIEGEEKLYTSVSYVVCDLSLLIPEVLEMEKKKTTFSL